MDSARNYSEDVKLIKEYLIREEEKVRSLANREAIHLFVDLADVEQFNNDLAVEIANNTYRYTQLFYEALDEILPSFKTKELSQEDKDIMDVFIEQRLFVAERNQRAQQNAGLGGDVNLQSSADPTRTVDNDIEGRYPPDLIRRVEVTFKPAHLNAIPIREVLSPSIGHLITVRGLVTRISEVKPRITVATYTCDQCGCETFQPVKDLVDYTPLFTCTSSACKASKAPGRLAHQIRGSKFVKLQDIRLQELADQVPTGHIPRAIKVIVYGELTNQCISGDIVSVSGIYLPVERSAFRLRTGGLSADTYIEAHYISIMSKSEDAELNVEPMSDEEAREFTQTGDDFLNRLSSSIAPEIFGHAQLKKALLLMLVGGVDKVSRGMKTRGNINICLMGDPGVAKSQLLGFIDRLASRSQYTTGRGSSGVGLTAAVLKDPITNELILEGGALVLADQGICCIDEFDKMMDADRTAIHEVMEQQTVSIAKAGIITTLNARVSILAAANPAYGRYNVHKSITDNLQLPPALLSRFDLLWLIKDQPRRENDLELAQHVTHIHANPTDDFTAGYDSIDMKVMRRYIALCKLKNPTVPKDLLIRYINIYLEIRDRNRKLDDDSLFVSPRSLLAIVRISTALARLRLADEVQESDINEAVRLYNCSRESLEGPIGEYNMDSQKILRLIDQLTRDIPMKNVQLSSLIDEAGKHGFSRDQVECALSELESIQAINLDREQVTRC